MTAAVLDANVLASGFAGFLWPTSTPGRFINAWLDNRFDLFISERVHAEVERTFQDPYFRRHLTPEQISDAQALLRRRAMLTPLAVVVQGVASHPDDDSILATAVSARADYLVTGDKELQDLGSYRDVSIVSPRAFLGILEQQEGRK